jgi:hypothetical protein
VESLQAALRESQEAGERVELTLTERMRQLTAAAAGAQVSRCTQLLQLGLRSVVAHSCCSWGSGQLVYTAAAAGAQVSWYTQLQ